ncbi:MAG TPA: hypothetical protein VJR04_02670 [Terriglobales bacterium]|nr:hypothetical protein [Terriglobales bacterium]
MKNFRIAVLILLIAIAAPFALHRRAWALHHSVDTETAASATLPVHIISPEAGQEVGNAYAVVQYQLSSKASGRPIYEVRIDGRDPVRTTDTNYTFNGLMPGSHDLAVQVVDANGAPISGTRSEVHFTVIASAATTNATGAPSSSLPPLPQPLANDLPNGNGSLPLLSIIGFGILVGGVISALRTRPAHK